MNKMYEMFLSETELWENDSYNFITNYFEQGAAVTSFLIALVVALVLLAIFYGIFGMLFPKVGENRWVWVVCLVASFGLTWIVTDSVVIGTMNQLSGLFGSINEQMKTVLESVGSVESDRMEVGNAQNTIFTELEDGCSFNLTLDFINSLLSLVVFFIGSVLVKRVTKYSQNVPF